MIKTMIGLLLLATAWPIASADVDLPCEPALGCTPNEYSGAGCYTYNGETYCYTYDGSDETTSVNEGDAFVNVGESEGTGTNERTDAQGCKFGGESSGNSEWVNAGHYAGPQAYLYSGDSAGTYSNGCSGYESSSQWRTLGGSIWTGDGYVSFSLERNVYQSSVNGTSDWCNDSLALNLYSDRPETGSMNERVSHDEACGEGVLP